MGTQYSVKVVTLPDGIDAAALQAEIDAELATVNDQMSTWQQDSELSLFNKPTGDDWFAVSRETAEVVDRGQAYYKKTDGAFDVTIGPLVNLWKFGPAGDLRNRDSDSSAPTPEELAGTQAKVGGDLLEVRLDPPALKKHHPELYVDLSAIAKGHGVDRVGRLLEKMGITDYMVEIGGEVRARGKKSDDSGWRIGIESPSYDSRQLALTVELKDMSLATSGDYRNFREIAGRRVSHTIDPRTAVPIEHGLASVSVFAEDCEDADAAATAIMVLGPEEGYNWAEAQQLPALFIVRDADSEFSKRATSKFKSLFPDSP
jgi:thiamine biosynthesis lipoprotein